MDAFPAFYPLSGRTVVIVGDGEAAEAKARLFEGSPSVVIRLVGDEALAPEAYRGAVLAFVAGREDAFLSAVATAARAAGVPVNIVDHPELSDFITPAVIDRGAVVAAVGTSGAAPLLAASLRNDIEALLPEGVGRLADLLGELREEVRGALPDPDPPARLSAGWRPEDQRRRRRWPAISISPVGGFVKRWPLPDPRLGGWLSSAARGRPTCSAFAPRGRSDKPIWSWSIPVRRAA